MIRINLLSEKIPPYQKKGKQLLGMGILLVLMTAGGCYYHFNYIVDHASIEKNNKRAKVYYRQASLYKKKLSKIKVISAKDKKGIQDKYRKKFKTVTRIEKIRSNPVFALLELSKILSMGQFPTIAKNNSQARLELDVNWDPSTIHIRDLSEVGRDAEIAGIARTHYDISEFTKRLKASAYFRTPEIIESRMVEAKVKGAPAEINFKIRAIMVY